MSNPSLPSANELETIFGAAGEAAPDQPGTKKLGGTLERKSISELVTSRIMAMIKSGYLKSGDRLPTEAKMCVAFGISRPPLREALKALSLMGVLKSRQGGRYTVTDLSPGRMVAPLNAMLSVTDYNLKEHFESRALIDVELTRLCALNATDAQRERISQLAEGGRAFFNDPAAFRLLDAEFHRAINEGANHQLLSDLSQILYDIGLDMRRFGSTLPGVIEKSVNQHCDVAQAIVDGDPQAAAASYRSHLEHVSKTTVLAIQATRRGEAPQD
jgi:GntR family transcriptional repressor for pyruvate dehydrogenase complex